MPKRFLSGSIYFLSTLFVIIATIILVRAFDARNLPDLKPWHTTVLESEFTEEDNKRISSLSDYLDLEEQLFQELDKSVYEKLKPVEKKILGRYTSESVVDPKRFPQNWNRSFELIPTTIRGGVLMLHGLTDSPYSMRHLAKIFQEQGFYVLSLRMPGHGTIPGALLKASWQDWMAATRLGARHVREVIDADLPFYLVGYSNGGALAVKYVMDAVHDKTQPMPERVFLFSPMIGVTFFARFSNWHKTLSWLPYFEKFRWLSVYPEYDPFKYNSFPKAAGEQTFLLTKVIHKQVDGLVASEQISDLPPILTFQSLVDATVLTSAIVDKLYNKLSPNGHELVLLDINRLAAVKTFIQRSFLSLLRQLVAMESLPYTLTVLTNESPQSRAVVAKSKKPQAAFGPHESLGLTWPIRLYSLSHVAIPFPEDDLLYGERVRTGSVNIGNFAPRGEMDVLTVPTNMLMRLRYNPFFDYLKRRIVELIQENEP